MESNSSPVDRHVIILTQRVTAAEEQIRQLIELTNSMRNEIASQQRIINAFTTISAERKLSNSKTTLPQFVSEGATPKVVDNSLLNTFETGNATLDTWDFESMDLDWDSLNVSAMNSSTNVTIPESVPAQMITTTRYYCILHFLRHCVKLITLTLLHFVQRSIAQAFSRRKH